MERKSFSSLDCSIAQCLEVVGEWWSLLIVRDAFLGVSRFDDFQRRLGISRNVLRQRLTHLVGAGVMEKVPYSEHPPRFEYRLTNTGRDLWPVLTAMRQWGDQHAAPNGPPVQFVHRACGATADVLTVCASCGERVRVGDMKMIPGPGRTTSPLATTGATDR
jgi:DNA-binding HxlR family transcriptional regulator